MMMNANSSSNFRNILFWLYLTHVLVEFLNKSLNLKNFSVFINAMDFVEEEIDGEHYIVKTKHGKIRGFKLQIRKPYIYHNTSPHNKGAIHAIKYVKAFLGIPYAMAPLHDLRFKHPIPYETPWAGTINATKIPNSCYQIFDTLFGNFSGSQMWNPNTPLSEDCLFLNIWIPDPMPRRPVAVMVWIFGGGFYSGSGSLDVYDGRYLAAANDVIVASFNYRVGSLGFLYLGNGEVPGNAGLFDQRLALKWIYENIAEFGGDPHRITLFGESAGAASVDMHLLSRGSWKYFERAILQSGSATNYWATVDPHEAIKRGLRLAEGLDCPFKLEKLLHVMECLKKADPWDIVTHDWVTTEYMKFPFVPVIEGDWFEEPPFSSTANHKFKKCPLMIGSNLDEGTYFNIYQLPNLFLPLDKDVTLERFHFARSLPDLFPQFNSIGHKAITHEYTNWNDDPSSNKNVLDSFDKSVGDYYFTCGVNSLALNYAKAGISVFKYYFTHRSSRNPWPTWMGVMHADEISFIFGEPLDSSKHYKPEEIELSFNMMRFWTNFAKTGNPNINENGVWSEIQWPLHTVHNKEFLRLSADSYEVGKGPRIRECAFWQEYVADLMTATEDLTEVEIQWKTQFHDWRTKYIVDWKTQFDKYMTLRHKTTSRNTAEFDGCHRTTTETRAHDKGGNPKTTNSNQIY